MCLPCNRFMEYGGYLALYFQYNISMKSKEFDDFSFKAKSSEPSEADIPIEEHPAEKIIRSKDINFRHEAAQKQVRIFDQEINTKIRTIDQQLQDNIKRRIELEKKLDLIHNVESRHKQRQIFNAYANHQYKTAEEAATVFKDINQKADRVQNLVAPKLDKTYSQSQQKQQVKDIEKLKERLLDFQGELPLTTKEKVLIPIVQTMASFKPKPIPVYTVPDQIKIQQLLRKLTFPQIPQGNLQKLRKQIQTLYAVHQPHSDIHYLLMIIYYHLQQYHKVRKHFEEIVVFKVYNLRAYWIAAETEFALRSWQLCLSISEECINRLQDKILPRMLYLKARCYDEVANYINSIVCYNQLIKLKPKISEYYLQRGLLFHRIGYYKEAKQDFVMFGLLRPDAQQMIKERVLAEKNEIKKKEYIALLAKMY